MLDQSTGSRFEPLARRQRRSLAFLLISCGQRLNEAGVEGLNRRLAGFKLRDAHTRLVPQLMREEGARMVDVARTLEVSKQAVQPLVAELERVGWVRVAADPDDARARRVHLTAAGLRSMTAGVEVLEGLDAQLRARLGAKKARALGALLGELFEGLAAPPTSAARPSRRRPSARAAAGRGRGPARA